MRTEAGQPHHSAKKPLKVSFFGHFGTPNPGNEGTLLAILSRLRTLSPGSEFRCICCYPEAVVARNGIDAVPITTRVATIRDNGGSLARRVSLAVVGVGAELWQYLRVFRELKGTDVLIVPGTGLVTDAAGLSAWGPYSQFKWILMAKMRGSKILYVSVGAGPIDGVLGKVLVKAALSLADYRSYRDDASKDYLRGIRFPAQRDRVYPDLVFSLPDALLPDERGLTNGRRRVVGLGLMEYYGRYSTTEPSSETYPAYLESLAEFAAWLLERDYNIRLLLGDNDTFVIEEFKAVLRDRLGGYDEERILDQPIRSVQDVLAEIAATDVVVATRFHNVLLALLLNKPVIAISFHHKCSSLMRQMKLSDYRHEIHQIDTDRLIRQFQKLEQNREAVKRIIGQGVDEARVALDEQYDLLFANL